ncbi:hypothetical protein BGY98DRAFT_1087326 [Russula aff. rugulosa BPL654]|nr:hypothetical protein BGY98DRAFT_1087326 [Russula aff. rugulosa BPL654]
MDCLEGSPQGLEGDECMPWSTHDCYESDSEGQDYSRLVGSSKSPDLLSSLERVDSNPSRPWSHYVDLLNYMGLDSLPLKLHQLVLRKCVPSARVLRAASKRERRTRYHPHAPHIYENRLQTVMKNIRSAGWQADLDDYHFVLEQFAAVGHYIGSRGVLQEMAFTGVQPGAKTYRLCLQALAFRLSLPCSDERRPTLIEETTKMTREVIRDMRSRDLPLEAVDTDLAIRIFRETVDENGFAELIKFSYGIDLAYPDRLPLEVVERPSTSASEAETSEELDRPLHRLQPLSTPALNVIIDMLGRAGRISKMVQAFEVLTQPLAKPYQSPPSLFDEDEDDFSFNPPSVPEPIYPLPSAPPNRTTFQLLIKHASTAGHAVFARHYLVYALRMDRDEDFRIKRGLYTRVPIDEIAPPRLAVNRNMFLPVFGFSNRARRIRLMGWTLRKIRGTLRRKRKDLSWYSFKRSTQYGQEMSSGAVEIPPSADPSSDGGVRAICVDPSHRESGSSIFDLDLDSDRPHSTPVPRIFNFDTHISHLQRDIQQLELLDSIVAAALRRIIDRIKERLGRRVWSGKDVFLADERARLPVTKEFWKEAVNFAAPEETKLGRQSRTQKMHRP